MKTTLFFLLIISSSIFSKGMRITQFTIKVLNSHNEEIKNASVFIDDIKATYDTITSNYLLEKEFYQTFDLKVTCEGYDTLYYASLNNKFVVSQIYLIQPENDYYYLQDGIKISYPLRPFELYIQLTPQSKEGKSMSPENAIESISDLLDSLGLHISYSSHNDTNLLRYELKSINSQSAFSKYVLIVKRKDGLKFDLKNSSELKALRLSPLVKIAGPLILHDNENKFTSYTHGNRINFTINPKFRNEDVTNFLLSIGLDRLEPSLNIIELPDENAIGVVEFAEELSKSNLFNSVSMDVYYNAYIDQNSQLKTANMDYFTRGNQKIAFQKKTNSIGVAFKNEISKASVMKLLEDWELTIDTVYMNGLFFVLNYPINLNLESVKTIRERIILFKDVTALGDILIQTENNLVLATQDMIIKWKPETSEAVKQTFIKQYSLTEIRKKPYMTGGFQYRIEPYVAYASTDICLKLLEADIVGFAEPVIISTSEDD